MAQDVFGIVGSVIAGAYRVEKVVAEGGFGVVYRAHHGGFRAPVALKCLKVPQNIDANHQATFLEQFRAEAELMFRLSAAISTVVRPLHIDAMTTPDGSFVPFMVLEWLEGETLDAIIRRRTLSGEGPLPTPDLVRLLSPVARALERAHHFSGPNGPVAIVHRDLKPENIFVARVAGEEVVKILDFGIGKVKSVANQVAGRASQEAGGLASFTPAYGSPEQWVPRKLGQTGSWTDVWGLGICVVEAMVGRPVIEGDHQAIMGTVLDETRRPTPRNEGVRVDDRVEAVLTRALAVDPRKRYASVGEFWNELLDALNLDETGAPRPSARGKLGSGPRLASPYGETHIASTYDSALAEDLELNLEKEVSAIKNRTISQTRLAAQSGLEIPDLDLAASIPPPKSVSVPPVSSRRPAPRPSSRPPSTGEFEMETGGFADFKLDLSEEDDFLQKRGIGTRPSLTGSSTLGGNPPLASGSSFERPRSSRPPNPVRETPLPPPPSSRGGSVPPGTGRASVPPAPPLASPMRPDFPAPTFAEPPTLVQKLWPGAALIGASILLTLVDQVFSGATGEMLMLGPLRATWIAGLLLLGGIGLLVYRILPKT
jgi:serine/threonine protein kinase